MCVRAESFAASVQRVWLFDQPAAATFEILVKVTAKNHTSIALGAEGTDWHRTTYIVCSIELSQGLAVVWGMECVYRELGKRYIAPTHRHSEIKRFGARIYWGMWVAGKVKMEWGTQRETLFFLPPALPPAGTAGPPRCKFVVFCTLGSPVDAHSTSISCRSI